MVSRVEKQLYKDGQVVTIDRSHDTVQPYFRWRGTSARAVVRSDTDEAFWVASVSGGVAVLLVGSVMHAVGAAVTSPLSFSPTVDPIGAAREFFERKRDDSERDEMYEAWAVIGWERVMSTSVGKLASKPLTTGIAQYAGSFQLSKPLTLRGTSETEIETDRLVIGSPLWVEQIAQPTPL